MSVRNTEPPGPSGGEDREFSRLFAGYANRELTGPELERLEELGSAHPERSDQLGGIEKVHSLFARERATLQQVVSPASAVEKAEPGYRRLQRAAEEGEQLLRGRLLRGVEPDQPAPSAKGLPKAAWILGAVAAVVVAGLLLVRGGGGPPGLLPGVPGPERLGGPVHMSLTAEITVASRAVSWSPVDGASTYTVVVEDGTGNVVLQRGEAEARSTRWELSEAEFRVLQGHTDGLLLRVVARDDAGIVVGTTGDLPLSIR